MSLHVIILAAGQGTRMKSSLPKVLHQLAGKPLLSHVIETARSLNPSQLHIVYGHGAELVKSSLDDDDIVWVYQEQQDGTGHAVQLALESGIGEEDRVCILYGDVPLLSGDTVHELLDVSDRLGVLTAIIEDPTGYGRIIRGETGSIAAIVEERDATDRQKSLKEINTGIMAGQAGLIKSLLRRIDRNNDQGELYLTDIIAVASSSDVTVSHVCTSNEIEITGINDRIQLAMMERQLQKQKADALMKAGITLYDPARLDVRGEITCGIDVSIDVNCVIVGHVKLYDGVHIGPNVYLKDCVLGPGTEVRANSVIEGCEVGSNVIIGPFARIRPETVLDDSVHIGNFVEVKKSHVEKGSKINHLSYVGDAKVGERVNIGAGTITCNYDGANKHKTIIEDDVFIGSGTELVAPITVGEGATTGAGSTLSKDVERGTLTVERSKVRILKEWLRPRKK